MPHLDLPETCDTNQYQQTSSLRSAMTARAVCEPAQQFPGNRGRQLRQWLSGFRRVTFSTRYIPEVDGLRFVALVCVFVFHLAGDILRHSPPKYQEFLAEHPIFRLSQHLNFGVQLFFVVSGFVLALPFAMQYVLRTQSVSLRRYLLRRLTRLEPPYMLALLLFFGLKIVGGRGSASTLLPHLLASVGYVHNLIYEKPSDINFVSWSLEIEVQFYLIAPLLAFLLFQPRRSWMRRVVIVALILASAFIPLWLSSTERVGLSLLGQLPYFLAGMLLADVYVVGQNRSQSAAWWGDLLTLGSISVLVLLFHNPSALTLLGPLAVFAAYWGALRSVHTRRALSIAGIATIGGMCYSIYLLHNYIVASAGYLTEPLSSNWPFEARLVMQFVLLGPLVLVVSGLFFRLIEQPCMKPEWPTQVFRFFSRAPIGDISAQPFSTTE